jgi:transposase-like protein
LTPRLKITIESLNYQLRKVTKARGHFPSDDAVVKLLWLAIANIEDKRARERGAHAARAASGRTSPPAGSQRPLTLVRATHVFDLAFRGV